MARMQQGNSAKKSHATQWRTVYPAAAVLIFGNEEYIVSTVRNSLRKQYSAQHEDAERVHLNAKDYRAGDLAQATSPSLFGGEKLVEITNVSQMSEDFLKDTLNYLESPEEETMVILHHSGGNRGKKLVDVFRASRKYLLVEAKPLKTDADKTSFVHYEFWAKEKKIEPKAVRLLIAAAGSDISELASACQQLIEDGPETITEEVVDTYYGGRTEVTAFKVSDAAVSGDSKQALRLLRHALDTGTEAIPLLGALSMRMRNIARVHGSRGNAQGLAAELKLAPWQVEQAQRDSRRYSEHDIALILRILADADAQLKGESQTPLYALEKAVLTMSRGK